jgi:hypothetical protein
VVNCVLILEENAIYYKHYDVHLFATPCCNEKIQINLIQDFDISTDGVILKKKNKFVLLSVISVIHNGENKAISSCSACESRSLLGYFFVQQIVDEPLSTDLLFSCKHAFAVVSRLRYKMGLDIDPKLENYRSLLYTALCNNLVLDNNDLVPGTWYLDDVLRYETKIGKLSIFFTECLQLVCVTRKLNANGSVRLHCYDCPRNNTVNGCTHSRLIPNANAMEAEEFQVDPEAEDVMEERANDYSIISKLTYPFNIRDDQDLSKVLQQRNRLGTRFWLHGKNETNHLYAATDVCCNTNCIPTLAPTRSRRCSLFSLNGFIYEMKLYNYWCSICNTIYHYDGRCDGIVNFGNAKLFCIELFLEALEFKTNAGVPTQAYWKSKLNTLAVAEQLDPLFSLIEKEWSNLAGKINEMMMHFVRLIDYPERIFQCCENPKIVTVDGIVLSVESSRIQSRKLKEPWIVPEASATRFSSRIHRHLILLNKGDRELLREYIYGGSLNV